jgi:hypothetical protein
MSAWRVCEGTGRFPRWLKKGGPWERWRVQSDTRSEPEASHSHASTE